MKINFLLIFYVVLLTACSAQNIESLSFISSVNADTLTTTQAAKAKILKKKPIIEESNKSCQNPDFLKQVTLGYQGWFSAKGDGVSNVWKHWSPYKKTPAKNNVTFEMYPDLSEYQPEDLFTTQLGKLGNGQPAKLFSSARDGVVKLHFQWLKDYGLDGVALQRFVSDFNNKHIFKHHKKVTQLVKKYAEEYCRTFYIMYDISGSSTKHAIKKIKRDWLTLMEKQLAVTDSKQYARYNNKPVIGLWGFGLNTPAHAFSQEQALDLIHWFKEKGFYIVGGVPYHWRQEQHDSRKNWLSVYQQYDMLLPWSVGRYRNTQELLHHYESIWEQDAFFAQQHHLQMKRVIFPGFAWSNWNKGTRNQIPRKKGDFLWKQAYFTRQLGLGAYIAMFDEYDEGTAIAKTANTPLMTPKDQYFLTLSEDGDQISTDFYLRLAKEITEMVHGNKKATLVTPHLLN